jgi:hypothetical protein
MTAQHRWKTCCRHNPCDILEWSGKNLGGVILLIHHDAADVVWLLLGSLVSLLLLV